jgi:hypothetical protein
MGNGAKMAKDIINAMKTLDMNSESVADVANERFGNAILQNICKSMKLNYTWMGAMLPPPANTPEDPGSFVATLSGDEELKKVGEPNDTAFARMLLSLKGLIQDLSINLPTGYALIPPQKLSFLSANTINISLEKMDKKTDHNEAINLFCSLLVTELLKWMATPSATGNHAPYLNGTATFVAATWEEPPEAG